MTILLDAALSLAARGFFVFPLQPRSKATLSKAELSTPDGKGGFYVATTDSNIIRGFWERWPHANIGIDCERSQITVIDPDFEGLDTWAALCREQGIETGTITVLTGGGGRHFYYRTPVGVRVGSDSTGKLGGGIHVKAAGGYVVAPPSVHPNGKGYYWEEGKNPSAHFLAPLPDPLLRLLTGKTPMPRNGNTAPAAPLDMDACARYWLAKALERAHDGERNDCGFWLACQLRDAQIPEDLAQSPMLDYQRAVTGLGDDPYTESEALASMKSAYEHPARDQARAAAEAPEPGTEGAEPGGPWHLTDLGNTRRFVLQHKDRVRYCHSWAVWLMWDGRRWQPDKTAEVVRLAKATVATIYAEAAQAQDEERRKAIAKWAMQSESDHRIKAMLSQAESEPEVAITHDALDADPWALNVLNGTIDLRTGALHPHNPDDLITKLAPVEYNQDARLELLERFLRDATGDDVELQGFLARSSGYSLTGQTTEEKAFLIHGPTNSGKTTYIEAMKGALGDYAVTADFETFLARSFVGGPRPDIARLAGSRFVPSVEVDQGKKLASGLVKLLTGGDIVVARLLYKSEFEFAPQFKLWLVANHEPTIAHDDGAMWRRMVKVPFDVTVPEEKRDPAVKATLRDPAIAGPAILAWAVRGCLEWQRGGLRVPERVKKATEAYRLSQDPLKEFIEACCDLGPDNWISATDLRRAYATWGEERGLKERDLVSGKAWGGGLRTRGCEAFTKRVEGKLTRGWQGVCLTSDNTGVTGDTDFHENSKSENEFPSQGQLYENDVIPVTLVTPVALEEGEL